ncbi:iron-containing alcohol dehydrogenase [Streptomyces acidiscabies]|uniref:iron-containing alcohol dehydrogenase n=1 Tax=Streptomyces acidiscabies TaxID=42234 RepID=UPI000D14798B|nr:iron-containing alcohol dehydrogenase [Streptomyces acidiscabies]
MWLLYEQPDLAFTDLREKFYDMRKRVFTFPETGRSARLICVPTTAGSGSEVTPFAVITDPATGLKHPLAEVQALPSPGTLPGHRPLPRPALRNPAGRRHRSCRSRLGPPGTRGNRTH